MRPFYKTVPFPRRNRDIGGIRLIYRLNIVSKPVYEFSTFDCSDYCLNYKGYDIAFTWIYNPPPSLKNKHRVKECIFEFQEYLDKPRKTAHSSLRIEYYFWQSVKSKSENNYRNFEYTWLAAASQLSYAKEGTNALLRPNVRMIRGIEFKQINIEYIF